MEQACCNKKNQGNFFDVLDCVHAFTIIYYCQKFCRAKFPNPSLFMLTEDQVRHIAKLARIRLTDEEVKKFSKQLSGVLDYMDVLNEVDTKKVAETSQVTGLKNVMEEDVILSAQSGREELLKCSELPIDGNQIRVKRIVK